jgi:hypothetical protein
MIDYLLFYSLARLHPGPDDLIARPRSGPCAAILDLLVTARLPGECGSFEIEGIPWLLIDDESSGDGAIVYGEIGGAWGTSGGYPA